jgi:hypothetical protein
MLREVLDEDSLIWTLLEIHLALDVLAQKVMDFLIVNFDEAAPDEMGFGSVVLCLGDYLTESSRNYAT